MFLNFFSKTEAGHVLKMFLQFWLISASRSYKLGSYKKKTCTGGFLLENAMSHFQTQSCLCSNYVTYINEISCGLIFYYVEENHRSDF